MKNPDLPSQWLEHDASVKPYIWTQRLLGLSGSAIQLTLLIAFICYGVFSDLTLFLAEKGLSGLSLWCAFFFLLGAGTQLLSLPFSVAHHYVERKHNLSKQSYSGWFKDLLKGWGLGIVLGGICLAVLYAIALNFPNYWWFGAWLFFLLFSILLAQLAPILLIPLFLKMEPMEAGPLRERLLGLCARYQLPVKEVYHLGLSEKTEKGNAAFLGLGKTKRIVIGDTLYKNFSHDEVEAVFGHELGHQLNNDLWKGIGIGSVSLLATYYIAQWVYNVAVAPSVPLNALLPYTFLYFFCVWSICGWPFSVMMAIFSRNRERAADRFAAERLVLGKFLASALERLTIQNRGLFIPNRLWEFIKYSHPAPWRRILSLRT